MTDNISIWGVASDGQNVERITLTKNDLSASIITYGASIQDLRIAGHDAPLVLGLDDIRAYERHGLFFGAIAGRCANRIACGQFKLAGEKFQLPVPDGAVHHLHGGPRGFANRVWKVEEVTDSQVVLLLESVDGDMGYPGLLVAKCTYALTDIGALDISLEAQCDAPTICNLTNHAYFNLEDGGRSDVGLHRMEIMAEKVCDLDETLAPTGQLSDVSGTQNDFRAIRPIGDYRVYDLNFCLADKQRALTQVARVVAPSSGVRMDVATTEPGIQLFTGLNPGAELVGLDAITYVAGAGLCLEAQIWPDAINHPNFPDAILMPGQTRLQRTQYRFSLDS